MTAQEAQKGIHSSQFCKLKEKRKKSNKMKMKQKIQKKKKKLCAHDPWSEAT